MKGYLTVALAALAGAALIEAALVPGLVIGGAAVLAPAVLPKLTRGSRRRARPSARRSGAAPVERRFSLLAPIRAGHKVDIGRSLAKTVTFRVVVTAIDFSANYVVLGDPVTAAGLSGISLVAGATFYFLHEALWNYYGPAEGAIAVRIPFLRPAWDAGEAGLRVVPVSRAIAKTVTFRTIATVMDFTVTYLILGDAATAALLVSFGFVLGPFIYWGHEKAWEAFAARSSVAPTVSLPAPQAAAP